MAMVRRHYRVLTGPTAGGKTGWLVRRSERRPQLAISADSRQVYRYMDIGTGKASAADQKRVPHFLLDIRNPDEPFSVYQYVMEVAAVFKELEARDLPADQEIWLVGGTGFYLRAILEDLELGLAPRVRLRAVLQDRMKYLGPRVLSEALGLKLIDPENPARVQRAAEQACTDDEASIAIYRRSGLSAADFKADNQDILREPGPQQWLAARGTIRTWSCEGIYVLDPGREGLQRNIERRVATMFAHGLLEEVLRLRELAYGDAPVVREGIGYREAAQALDNLMPAAEALKETIVRTRQYAKRQRTFYRGQGWDFYNEAELDAKLAEK
jgi:tRNA dimethylallyltransferase